MGLAGKKTFTVAGLCARSRTAEVKCSWQVSLVPLGERGRGEREGERERERERERMSKRDRDRERGGRGRERGRQ